MIHEPNPFIPPGYVPLSDLIDQLGRERCGSDWLGWQPQPTMFLQGTMIPIEWGNAAHLRGCDLDLMERSEVVSRMAYSPNEEGVLSDLRRILFDGHVTITALIRSTGLLESIPSSLWGTSDGRRMLETGWTRHRIGDPSAPDSGFDSLFVLRPDIEQFSRLMSTASASVDGSPIPNDENTRKKAAYEEFQNEVARGVKRMTRDEYRKDYQGRYGVSRRYFLNEIWDPLTANNATFSKSGPLAAKPKGK